VGRFAFVGRRLLQAVPLLLGVVFLTFLIIKVTPGDPARALAGNRASPEDVEAIREELGLNDNVGVQYVRFLDDVVHGDLGVSNRTKTPVSELIGDRLPETMWLVGLSAVLLVVLAVPAATMAALRRDGAVDHLIRAASLLGLGMPVFWVGLMLVILVAIPTGLFPVGGQFGTSPIDHVRATFLPATAMAFTAAPVVLRSLRSSMVDVLESDYVAAARSVGVGGSQLVRRHVLRNAAVPMVSLLAVQISYLLFGAVIIENTFDLPGLGEGMVFGAAGRDFPVVIGITLVFAVGVVLVHLVGDVVLAVLDPRVRVE
jgi:peptide/nickel transport system permease protein